MPAGGVHQQFALQEGTRHGFFQIHVLAIVQGQHSHGEMCEVRNSDADGVEVIGVLLKELPEIREKLGLGECGDGFAAALALRIYVAQGHDIAETGTHEIADDLGSTVGNADGSQPDLALFPCSRPLGAFRCGKMLHAQDGSGCSQSGRLDETTSGKHFHGDFSVM